MWISAMMQAVEVTWPTVALALVNVIQVVALAFIASEQWSARKEREYRREREG